MARGTQFGELINMFRDETGMANSRRLGKNQLPGIMALLRRTYRRLHTDYNWPHLKIERDKTLFAGQRYYAFPLELDFDRITMVTVREAGQDEWYPLAYGIDYRHLNTVASEDGEREDFPHSWEIYESDQFQIWPIPESEGHIVKFEGLSRALPLIAENEVLDLDDDLIVLYAAAEWLTRRRSADADVKLQLARQHYNRLKANQQKGAPVDMRVSHDRNGGYKGIQIQFAERRG